MAMLKGKEDKKVATAVAIATKKGQVKNKRAKDTSALVTAGSEILKRLEQLRPFVVDKQGVELVMPEE